MPLYDHRCPDCGPFEHRAPAERAGDPVDCPACDAPASRRFGAPAGRSARRTQQLAGLGAAAVRRVDRSIGGQPTVGPRPAGGRRTGIGAGPPTPPRPAQSGRPWQLGH